MTDASTRPGSGTSIVPRKLAPFLTRRTLLLLFAALLVTLLFVREHRKQQGPCRTQFHSLQTNQPRLLRVQDDENPGDAGPPADPCNAQNVFTISPERAYAALALALWGVTAFCSAQDISAFRKSLRRRRMRRAENRSQMEGGQTS